MNAELRHLRAFLALAEELSFTRAARRIHVTQQSLSKRISQLEEHMGVSLVDRTSRSVALTAAGQDLADRLRHVLADLDAAVDHARAVDGAGGGTLTVGFQASLDHERVRAFLDQFVAQHPHVRLQVAFGALDDPTGGLRERSADVALVHGPFDHTGIDCIRLWDEPRGLAMAADHPLAAKEPLTLADYVAEPTFDIPSSDRAWRDFWTGTRHRNGTPPRFVAQFRTIDALIEALRSGMGVYPSIERLIGTVPGVVCRDLADLDPMEYQVAWRSGDERPLVREFAEAMTRAHATAEGTSATGAPGSRRP